MTGFNIYSITVYMSQQGLVQYLKHVHQNILLYSEQKKKPKRKERSFRYGWPIITMEGKYFIKTYGSKKGRDAINYVNEIFESVSKHKRQPDRWAESNKPNHLFSQASF